MMRANSIVFALTMDFLFKKDFSTIGSRYLLVVPTSLCFVLWAMHDDPTSGHLWAARVLGHFQERFYWSKMHQTMQQYASSWKECQRPKCSTSVPSSPPPRTPFMQIAINLLNPFPQSSKGNYWIVVLSRISWHSLFRRGWGDNNPPHVNSVRFDRRTGDRVHAWSYVSQGLETGDTDAFNENYFHLIQLNHTIQGNPCAGYNQSSRCNATNKEHSAELQ